MQIADHISNTSASNVCRHLANG